MEHMYEEVEMSTEHQTDSENDMHEVIVGEEVIEQNLDDVIYSNTFEGRPVRRKIPPVTKREYITGIKTVNQLQSPKQIRSTGVVPKGPQQQTSRSQSSSSSSTLSSVRPMPLTRPVKIGPGQVLSPQALTLKRKTEHSPLVIKLEDVKKPKLGTSPIARALGNMPKTPTVQPKVRYVKHSDVQTEMTGDVIEQYQQIIEEDQQRIQVLEEKLKKFKYTPEMFENDDKKTHYFTGLDNFVNMITLFNNCEPELPASITMSKFEMFILTLMKLRLKLPMPLLGYMFGVSSKTALFFFNECMTILHGVMRQIFIDEIETVDVK